MTYAEPITWPTLIALLVIFGFSLYERLKPDPSTKEILDREYREGEISLEEYERRLDVLEDPEADRIRSAVEPIPGIGEATSWHIAERYDSEHELREADVEDLREISGVGEKRAQAIKDRL